MLKFIRFLGLVSQAILLQFAHVIGLVALVVAIAAGSFRLKSWVVPLLAVAFGVAADKLVNLEDLTGLLDKAATSSMRGGFLIVDYFVICFVGYLLGAYGRHQYEKRKAALPPPNKV
jgi:uncharacterized membrane protein YqgA involved in biofilm formation